MTPAEELPSRLTRPYSPPAVASSLTEDAIKRAFLPFLKQFYKFRYEYRPETMTAELDNVSAEGLVADGMVRFRKDDGSLFTCTYEATSRDKAAEVKFRQNLPYFRWDCAAFGAFTAAAIYSFMYVTRFPWLLNLKWNGNLGMLLGIWAIGFFAWFFGMRGWKKYRYIYAVEQFKRYFADEQWVALGADVFPAPNDPYLVELKDQCVYNGFGLALVAADGQVRPLATPSRLGIFGKDRNMAHWVTRTAFYQTMAQNIGALAPKRSKMPDALRIGWNQVWRPLERLLVAPVKKQIRRALGQQLDQPAAVFDRFMSAHTVQKWILSFSVLAVVLLGYRVLTFREESRYGNIADYRSERLTGNPEDENYSLDPRDEPLPYVSVDRNGIPKQYPEPPGNYPTPDETRAAESVSGARKSPSKEPIQTITLSQDDDDDTPTINLSGDEEQKTPPAKTSAKPAVASGDPCAALRQGWFVQDNVFSSQSFADERVAALRKAKVTAASAPRSCLTKGQSGYLVWLGTPQAGEAAARQKAGDYEKTLRKAGLLRGPLLVRKISQ